MTPWLRRRRRRSLRPHTDPVAPHNQPSRWKLASHTEPSHTEPSTPDVSTSGATTTTVPAAPASATVRVAEQAAAGEQVDRRVAETSTTTAPATTTTTTPLVVAPPPGVLHYGQVTYYDHPAGTCASPWLPFGTVVEVINPANGYTVNCVVNDREADTDRSIDLATTTFAALAPLSQGVIDAQLRW